ncbi:MAG TPA: aldose epimerase family protein [Candidatus Limnocylindria bacterium]|nr:aldose epimerase family protein [Candidatus Limnocylindria bacterium]
METTVFGRDAQGREAVLITLTNSNGLSAVVTNYGARLVSLYAPDRLGDMADVCLGYPALEDYMTRSGYLGATVGRYANRIGGSAFELNGKTYSLYANNGANSLHGGKEGFDGKFWAWDVKDGWIATFNYTSPDGEEGYPGRLDVRVTYSFSDDDGLHIEYHAVSDADTVVNLTNHSYFNLAGRGTIHDQLLTVQADYYLETGADLIPTGNAVHVEGTPYDLRWPARIGDRLERIGENAQFDSAGGFDVDYILRDGGMGEAAVLLDPQSGRRMRVLTDQPGLQVYSGQGLKGPSRSGPAYGPFSGIALETQHHPDSVHLPDMPSVVLKKGEVYLSETIYAFDVMY